VKFSAELRTLQNTTICVEMRSEEIPVIIVGATGKGPTRAFFQVAIHGTGRNRTAIYQECDTKTVFVPDIPELELP
jgi:hypothetical protein